MSDYDKGGTLPIGAATIIDDLRAERVFTAEQWEQVVTLLSHDRT